ncbi:A/G-specific adenine glycosylase [Aquimarina sp. MMG016]|uniref:A/G-specific adenine glycosylase n=1 Tax=Aquimarina sp. MMG016 TaxID=2822690 RepID=UPI001B39DF67|nr:A/G-specific adenine glycosylase [Aquimarina sp. MMG016]MBQ4819802.1 A/G-specific adenine glycosylase [Aquimarina sp. MMG016]
MKFSKKLITWYLQNKRTMPWRETTDPYRIWLSEIILQQTRVAQGLPYYLSFTETFPTVFDLANAEEEKVLKLWQGLGYYSRARNLHFTAKYVANQLNGVFPSNYKDLLKLKGVGDYTASAIASICYNEVVPVVDGNVYRVLSRYFDIDIPINSTQGIKKFKELAVELVDHDEPATYNQAIMEFGALQCKPKSPYCVICPLNDSCEGLKNGKVDSLPIKLKKLKVKKRYFNYLVFSINEQQTIIQQRTGKGIWLNLYEFPLIESDQEIKFKDIESNPILHNLIKDVNYEITLHQEDFVVHKLSHQHLYTRFYIIKVDGKLKAGNGHRIVNSQKIHEYPVPILLGNFIDSFFS